jgi:hypothetical protein
MSSIVRSRELASHPGLPVAVELRPIRAARRLRLRFDDRRSVLTLTCPLRTSRRAALDWAATQRPWVDAQIARAAGGEPFVPGAIIPIEGSDVRLEWSPDAPRTAAIANGVLHCGGPEEAFGRRVETFLKRLALERLSAETAEIAAAAGVAPSAVGVGDAATRWGSCSSQRRIRYSWRLILAPPEVRRYIVAHEVAHLVHMNHGEQFKALEARLHGGPVAPVRRLLTRIGPRLKRIGRG